MADRIVAGLPQLNCTLKERRRLQHIVNHPKRSFFGREPGGRVGDNLVNSVAQCLGNIERKVFGPHPTLHWEDFTAGDCNQIVCVQQLTCLVTKLCLRLTGILCIDGQIVGLQHTTDFIGPVNLCDRLDNALDRSEYAGAHVGVFFTKEPFHCRLKFLPLLEDTAPVVVLTNFTLV